MSDTGRPDDRRVLLITYDFPPSGGSGVQRPTKMAKYLPRNGWQPIVLTAKRGHSIARDQTLVKDVEHVPVYRVTAPYPLDWLLRLRKMLGQSHSPYSHITAPPSSERISFRSLLIPDAKVFWFPFGVRWAKRIDPDERCDVVLSTTPTPTAAMIGWRIAKYWGVPHVIDYRDPWHGVFDSPKRPSPISRLEYSLEQTILRSAAAVITVEETHAKEIRERTANRIPVHLIYNGYDEADFDGVTPRQFDRLTIAHTGFMFSARGALPIVTAIESLVSEGVINRDAIELLQVGPIDADVAAQLDRLRRTIRVTVSGSVDHRTALSIMMGAQVLYLPTVENFIPGKVFEYMRTCRPILTVGWPATNLKRILSAAGREQVYHPQDIDGIKLALLAALNFNGNLEVNAGVRTCSRESQAAQVAAVLDESVGLHFSKTK